MRITPYQKLCAEAENAGKKSKSFSKLYKLMDKIDKEAEAWARRHGKNECEENIESLKHWYEMGVGL